MKRNWTYRKHGRWGDFEILDTQGWVVCVVGNEGTAKLICDAINGMTP